MKQKPNFILLVLDGLRNDRILESKYSQITAPFLHKLKERGTYFSNCRSVSNASLPSHVSLFTGKLAYEHKASSNYSVYDGRFPFITEVLQENGYIVGGVSTENPYFQRETGFLRGFDYYTQVVKTNKQNKKKSKDREGKDSFKKQLFDFVTPVLPESLKREITIRAYRYHSNFFGKNDLGGQKIIEDSLEMIESMSGSENPFFLFANVLDTHVPLYPLNRYRDIFNIKEITDSLLYSLANMYLIDAGKLDISEEDIQLMHTLYNAKVRYVDDLVNYFIRSLEQKNLLENTYVFICSDHGEILFEKDKIIGHGHSLYEEVLQVPMICLGENFPTGRVDDHPVSTIDLFGTILEILGKRNNQHSSLFSTSKNRSIFADHPETNNPRRFLKIDPELLFLPYISDEKMVIKDKKKLIYRGNSQHLLFDLEKDPGESHNIFYENPKLAGELMNELIETYKDIYPFCDLYPYNKNIKGVEEYKYPKDFFDKLMNEEKISFTLSREVELSKILDPNLN